MTTEDSTPVATDLEPVTTTHQEAVKVSVKVEKKPKTVTIQYTAKAHNVPKWSIDEVKPETADELVKSGAARIINN